MKRIFFLFMTLCLMLTSITAMAFTDVSVQTEHIDAIGVLTELGVIGGYEDDTFRSEQPVTRAEMAKLVYVLYTTFQDAGAGFDTFADVAKDHWAKGYISWCAAKNMIGGHGDGTFTPEDGVTYDQALKMVCGALGYTDWNSALWPVDVRTKARDLKLGENLPITLNGNDKLTRGQVAQIMYNAFSADMNETKNVPTKVGNITIDIPVAKKLATDVWNFVEDLYVITKVDVEKNTVIANGVEYEVNGDLTDCIGFTLSVITKNDKVLSARIKGTYVDNLSIVIEGKKDKVLKINGVVQDLEDEKAIMFNGKVIDIAVLEDVIAKSNYYRFYDYDGDGKYDNFIAIQKTAYKVESANTKKVIIATLDGKTTKTLAVEDANIELAKGDVIVGVIVNDKLIAEKVEPVQGNVTSLGTDFIKLNNKTDEIKFTEITVAGVATKAIDNTIFDCKDQLYYVYNGELLDTTAAPSKNVYNFAILKEVVKGKEEFDITTMQYGTTYKAIIVVAGKEEEIVLDALNGEELYDAYKATIGENGKIKYNYALISSYENTETGYVISFADINDDKYEVIPAGTIVKYDATLGAYTINDKIYFSDDNMIIYYTYVVATGVREGFIDLGYYTTKDIADKSFEFTTTGKTYIAKGEEFNTILATMIDGEIEAIVEKTASYDKNGMLIYYAVDNSSVEKIDEKIVYNYALIGMNGNVCEISMEAKDDLDHSMVAGKFYGFDTTTETFVEITKDMDTFVNTKIKDVIESLNIIEMTNGDMFKIDNIKILGISDEGRECNVITTTELYDMIQMFEANEAEINVDVRIIKKINTEGNYDVITIIVDLYEIVDDEIVRK